MSSSCTRLINLSAGAVVALWGTIENLAGDDITGGQLQVALAEGTPVDGDWKTPDDHEYVGLTKARVLLMVGDDFTPPKGAYIYWARSTLSPEVAPVRLGIVKVI